MTLRDAARSIPGLQRIVRNGRRQVARFRTTEPLSGFYTLSPDVLVALGRVLVTLRDERAAGNAWSQELAYYEFGLFRGFSLWFTDQFSRQMGLTDLELYGFDSFEGLPAPQLDVEAAVFSKGEFRGSYGQVTANLTQWRADMSRIELLRGFYSDELFRGFENERTFRAAAVCLIDVDLYESTVPVLTFLRSKLVPGTFVLFDDFDQIGPVDDAGERRAFAEFRAANPEIEFEHQFDYGWEGTVYRVTSAPGFKPPGADTAR